LCLLGFTKAESIDPKLMIPVFDILFPFLPEKILSKLRFGIRYGQDVTQVNKTIFSLTDCLLINLDKRERRGKKATI
jgi:hypothetical protein